jgi:hypothetical protein
MDKHQHMINIIEAHRAGKRIQAHERDNLHEFYLGQDHDFDFMHVDYAVIEPRVFYLLKSDSPVDYMDGAKIGPYLVISENDAKRLHSVPTPIIKVIEDLDYDG